MFFQFMILRIRPYYQERVLQEENDKVFCSPDRAKILANGVWHRLKSEAEDMGLSLFTPNTGEPKKAQIPATVFAVVAINETQSALSSAVIKRFREHWIGKSDWWCFGNLKYPWHLTRDTFDVRALPLRMNIRLGDDPKISKPLKRKEFELNLSLAFQEAKVPKDEEYRWRFKDPISYYISGSYIAKKAHFMGPEFDRLTRISCIHEDMPRQESRSNQASRKTLSLIVACDKNRKVKVGTAFYGNATWPCWLRSCTTYEFMGCIDRDDLIVISWGGEKSKTSQLILGQAVLDVGSVLTLFTGGGSCVYQVSEVQSSF